MAGGWKFTAIAAGQGHTCAVTAEGRGHCWGRNGSGQLGTGEASATPLATPVAVAGEQRFRSVGVGETFSCGLATTGAAFCWGESWDGALGRDTTESYAPAPIQGGLRFRSLSVGPRHACALTARGAAYCWGSNQYEQLGGPCLANLAPCWSARPVLVRGVPALSGVSAGYITSCAVASSGLAYCWAGQAGVHQDHFPQLVPGRTRFQAVSAGSGFACGVTTAGQAACWGDGSWGRLGREIRPSDNTDAPSPVAGDLVFRSASAGGSFACGVTIDGAIYCSGMDTRGQLGDHAVTRQCGRSRCTPQPSRLPEPGPARP